MVFFQDRNQPHKNENGDTGNGISLWKSDIAMNEIKKCTDRKKNIHKAQESTLPPNTLGDETTVDGESGLENAEEDRGVGFISWKLY